MFTIQSAEAMETFSPLSLLAELAVASTTIVSTAISTEKKDKENDKLNSALFG